MIKIGDKVKVLNENYNGIVKEIYQNKFIILNDFGFEEKFDLNEIISFINVEEYNKIETTTSKNSIVENKKIVLKNPEIIEVDLHIGNLVDSFNNLTNFEMLQIQIKKINETLDGAIKNNVKKVIFIHGKGKGILKNELYKILEERKILHFFDASYNKYKMGATEIRL
ncbi:MAG: Smr/MutS family protein [Solirubrobacteraceae bacterium]